MRRFIFILLFISLFYAHCDQNGTNMEPKVTIDDYRGYWSKINYPSISVAIGNIQNQDENRVLICDLSPTGGGCIWGNLTEDFIVLLDDPDLPDLLLQLFDDQLRINAVDGSPQSFTGNFRADQWPEGKCGYSDNNSQLRPLSDKCIVGEWYTLVPDPFGGPSSVFYKNYLNNGNGEFIIPDDNVFVTFRWRLSDNPNESIVFEYDFSVSSYSDVSYAYLCTETGLALGIAGKSWIRKSLVCF